MFVGINHIIHIKHGVSTSDFTLDSHSIWHFESHLILDTSRS